MESLTKNKQSYETINEMVHKAFNEVSVIEVTELKEGFFNVAYIIKLSDEREVILKVAPPKNALIMTYEKNIMFVEVETMRLLRSKTDLPIAEVLYYDNSYTMCESDYFFMSKFSGRSLNSITEELDEENKKSIDYKLGEFNAKINSITGEKFGYYGQPDKQEADWYKVFSSMVDNAINDAKALNIDIGVSADIIKELLSKDKAVFEEVKIPKLVHWDLWAGNIFIENGKVTGLIDFERCLWADELMEVGFRSYNHNENFFNGYRMGTLTDIQKIRVKWYDLYLFLIVVSECDYRHYEDREIYNWARQMIIETVDLLYTINERIQLQ